MTRIPTPFNEGDDGLAPPTLLAALETFDTPTVIEALREQRLFVGVVAMLTSTNDDGSEKESEMALAVLEHEGRQVLPVFTSIPSMLRWQSDARPVAVVAEAAGLQAIAEGMAGVLVDPADPHAHVILGHELRALVLGYPLVPFHEDPAVASALERAVSREPAAATAWMEPGAEVDAVVTVLIPDLPVEQARPIAERIAEAVASDEAVRLRVEKGIDVQVVAAR
jgi:hypothetical protein